MLTTPTAADLRAELARHRLKQYQIAPRIPMHPNNLSLVLQEHRPLSPELAARILEAIAEETRSA